MTVLPGVLTLSQVKVCEFTRNKQKAVLFTNPLGKACYELNEERVKACLDELEEFRFLEAGLVYASEVRTNDRPLNSKEWRSYQLEIGCQPLHLTCLACGHQVERFRKEGAQEKAKAIQVLATEIVKLLIEYGARLDLVDVGPMENTALHLAARFGAANLLSSLLVLGADPAALDGDGCTPELVAKRAGQTLCQQILQVVVAEEQKDLDLLDSPTHRRKLASPQRGRDPAAVGTSTAAEEVEPMAKARKGGTKYGSQGLWAMLRTESGSDRSSVDSDGMDSSELSASDASDFEDRIRMLVLKLRKRKVRHAEQLQEVQAEHQALQEDSQRLEELAASLKERFKTLTDRLARFDAGELASTREEMASERELRDWWHQRSSNLSTQVTELIEQRKQMREQKCQDIQRLEREVRYHQRRVQGLENYWEQFFEAECAAGVIDLLSAEQRCRELEKELKKMVTYAPDILPDDLPQFFQHDGQRENPRSKLTSTTELCAAAVLHRKIHTVEMEHKAKVNEMTDFCNGRFAEKERHIMAAIEKKITDFVQSKLDPKEGTEAWSTIARMIEDSRRKLAEAEAVEGDQPN